MRRSTVIRTGIATVALTALGLVAAMPASAHTSNMYTYVFYNDQTEQTGFAVYGKTDGSIAPMPTTFVVDEIIIYGIEVFGEKGTYLINNGELRVGTWNHTTGERTEPNSIGIDGAFPDEVIGLDTLNNGTTVTLIEYEPSGTDDTLWAIASVNSDTGELIPLVDLTGVMDSDDDFDFKSLATDPATGITYVFLGDAVDGSWFLPVDVAANTVGSPALFPGDRLDEGEFFGADFDVDSTLYFNYDNFGEQELQLLKLGDPASWLTAEPTYISSAPADESVIDLELLALTIEHTALAATGSELPIAAIVFLGSFAVLAGGVTVMVARRRSAGPVV